MTKIKLSTSEMAHLWTTYINDSLANYVLSYFANRVEDKKVKKILDFAISISQNHLIYLKFLFEKENFPLPTGFTSNDVNLAAPRLYSDSFYLYYLKNMALIGGNGYSLALGNSARVDIVKYFKECVGESSDLYEKSSKLLLEKGLFLRPPQINTPKKIDFVNDQSFLTGWFGKRRPLTSIEIMNLHLNIERNDLGRALLTGFQQVAKSKEVRNYVQRGIKISSKHIEVFGSILSESGLPSPMIWNTLPTESTEETFSDKLIMFHISALTAASTSHYGTSVGSSPRRDIGTHFTRLTSEILKYAEDGANIMIKNGWLEQPPSTTDRNKLSKDK
ncbi:hypothetical protein HNQ94_003190 [Salirhabdus euzebyi]|uniref:DUF3231 family protein n=1 Tax=Salirhabdus euzebyi TaxID=394506 RepID=A0A841Q8B4_9BACI|nr:DUF3231 family protein [Salirhabdus euzebyi]MBB6454701.1 hypothetical protein [Salirhabdus euzebyi]